MFKMHQLLVIVVLLAWAGVLGLVAKVFKPIAPYVSWLFKGWEQQFEAMTVHYMSSNAILAQGTKFAVSADVSPPSWSDIPEISTLGGPDGSSPTIDVTDLDSTGREYLVGLKDEGSFALGINYIMTNAVHMTLRAAWANRTKLRFRITWPDTGTTVWEFSGYITGFAGDAGVDQAVTAQVTIKITGSIYETT